PASSSTYHAPSRAKAGVARAVEASANPSTSFRISIPLLANKITEYCNVYILQSVRASNQNLQSVAKMPHTWPLFKQRCGETPMFRRATHFGRICSDHVAKIPAWP